MADFDVIYQDSRDAGQSTSRIPSSGRSIVSHRANARRGLGESGDSIGGSHIHNVQRRSSSNNAIAGPSSGDGVAAIEDDEGSAMVAIVEGDITPDGYNFAALTPDPVIIRGAGNITV